jgi:hypothetical protein
MVGVASALELMMFATTYHLTSSRSSRTEDTREPTRKTVGKMCAIVETPRITVNISTPTQKTRASLSHALVVLSTLRGPYLFLDVIYFP